MAWLAKNLLLLDVPSKKKYLCSSLFFFKIFFKIAVDWKKIKSGFSKDACLIKVVISSENFILFS